MTLREFYKNTASSLRGLYPRGEAEAIAMRLLEELYSLGRADLLLDHDKELMPDPRAEKMLGELLSGRPLQYVTGHGEFMGLDFKLGEGVLIPRPETEELVLWVIDSLRSASASAPRILDIGTGSGCIAVSLKSALPHCNVSALDRSPEALAIAAENAGRNRCEIEFTEHDILGGMPRGEFDCIVSNPPYVLNSEATSMRSNVLDHEPHVALFVDDSDPLLFYRAIALGARESLSPGGLLFFEINERFGSETVDLLRSMGYEDIVLRRDIFDRDRMVKAVKP